MFIHLFKFHNIYCFLNKITTKNNDLYKCYNYIYMSFMNKKILSFRI